MTFQKKICGKADPLSFFCFFVCVFVFDHSDPLSAGKVVLWQRDKGATTRRQKPTVGFGRPPSPRRPKAVLVSVRTHASCVDEGWTLSTVLECIGTAGVAGMPAVSLLSLASSDPPQLTAPFIIIIILFYFFFIFAITDEGQTALVSKQIRS